jgi:hypothetical protein
VALLAAGVSLGAASAVAQTDAPRTAWGQPDLQGVWDFRTITPLQRPESLADQEFLTEEEAANLDQAAVDRNTRLWNQDAQRTEAGENVDSRGRGEAPGSYNQFWDRLGHEDDRDPAHVADHRSAERKDALVDTRRRATRGGTTGVSE